MTGGIDGDPVSQVVLTPFELELLDAAAFSYCEFWAFRGVPHGSPSGMVQAIGVRPICDGISVLLRRGLIVLIADGSGTPCLQFDESMILTELERKYGRGLPRYRVGIGHPAGYKLTQAGAAAWESYRRPLWSWFIYWMMTANDMTLPNVAACIATDEQFATSQAHWVARAAGCAASDVGRAIEIEGWRETYWREPRAAFRIEIQCEPLKSGDLGRALMDYRMGVLGDVSGICVRHRYFAVGEEPRLRWRK